MPLYWKKLNYYIKFMFIMNFPSAKIKKTFIFFFQYSQNLKINSIFIFFPNKKIMLSKMNLIHWKFCYFPFLFSVFFFFLNKISLIILIKFSSIFWAFNFRLFFFFSCFCFCQNGCQFCESQRFSWIQQPRILIMTFIISNRFLTVILSLSK